mgnify:CR=1 FL=1
MGRQPNLFPEPWEKAVEAAERIRGKIDDLPERVKQKALNFFEGVYVRAGDFAEKIEKYRSASPKQIEALANMEAAVDKWIHN